MSVGSIWVYFITHNENRQSTLRDGSLTLGGVITAFVISFITCVCQMSWFYQKDVWIIIRQSQELRQCIPVYLIAGFLSQILIILFSIRIMASGWTPLKSGIAVWVGLCALVNCAFGLFIWHQTITGAKMLLLPFPFGK